MTSAPVTSTQPDTYDRPRLHEDGNKIRDRYRAILQDAPNSSVYQTVEWLSVFRTMGADLVFAEVGKDILIPFICKGRGPLRRAYSLPYDTYGGPMAVTSAPVSFAQIAEVMNAATLRVVDYAGSVELGGARGEVRDVATYLVDLEEGYDAVFGRYADTNQRLIRQSAERGLRVSVLEDDAHIKLFHQVHVSTMKKFHARGFSLSFFRLLYRNMVPAGLATLYLAWYKDEVIGGNIVLRHGRTAYDWEWVYNEKYAHLRPTNALIDRAISDEIKRGATQMNLGASPDDRMGSVRFKKSFGAEASAYRIFARQNTLYTMARRIKSRARLLSIASR